MTLTVPVSNRSPGRAAQPQGIEPLGLGEAASGLGDIANRVGRQMEAEQLQHQAQRAQVDYTRELGELRLQIEEIADPDAKDTSWQQGVSTIRDRYLGEAGGLDPRVRRELDTSFDGLANQHALEVGMDAIRGRRARAEALWIEQSHSVATQAAVASPELKDELLGQAFDMLDQLERSNTITADEAARRRLGLVGEVDNASAMRVLAADPETFKQMQAEGAFDSLGPEVNARYANQADTAIAAAAEKAEKEAEKAAKERQDAIGDRLGEMTDIYTKGRLPLDEKWLADPEVQAHPDYARVMAARRLRENKIDLQAMTPDAIAAEIERERDRPVVFKYQTEYLDALEEGLAKAEADWTKDPVAAARDRLELEVPALDPAADTAALAGTLAERVGLSNRLQRDGYTDGLALMDEAEAAAMKEATGVEVDPGERARIAAAAGLGLAGVPGAMTQLSEDPVFAHVAGMLASGGSRNLAVDIFRGQQAIANETALLPPVKDRTSASFETFGALLGDVPGGDALQAQVVAAADALYARRKRLTAPTDDIEEEGYRQALHEVLGGTGGFDSGEARGGIQEVAGAPTLLPPGVSARRVDEAFYKLGTGREPGIAGRVARVEPDPAKLQGQLTAIARNGQPPVLGGKPIDGGTFQRLQVRAVGNDAYVLVLPYDAGGAVLMDESGEEYVFSMSGLLREARR